MKSGVYKIENTINNKVYVGYAKNILERFSCHKGDLKRNNHKNPHLQNAWNEYGIENFKFEILEECLIEQLCLKEHLWALKLNSHNKEFGYNEKPTDPKGISGSHSKETRQKLFQSRTGKKLSQITKDRIGIANKGNKPTKETIDKISRKLKGRSRSEETKMKMSIAQTGRIVSKETKDKISVASKGRIVSEKTKQKLRDKKVGFRVTWGNKISEINFKNPKIKRVKVVQYNKDMEEIEVWDSLLRVERELGINNANLHKCCQKNADRVGKFLTLKGYIWKFKKIE